MRSDPQTGFCTRWLTMNILIPEGHVDYMVKGPDQDRDERFDIFEDALNSWNEAK